jgi:hypothetical protein
LRWIVLKVNSDKSGSWDVIGEREKKREREREKEAGGIYNSEEGSRMIPVLCQDGILQKREYKRGSVAWTNDSGLECLDVNSMVPKVNLIVC